MIIKQHIITHREGMKEDILIITEVIFRKTIKDNPERTTMRDRHQKATAIILQTAELKVPMLINKMISGHTV